MTEKVEYNSQEEEEWVENPELEKRVVRKLDLFILPVTIILYILSFLDRSSLGNMLVTNMVEDLNLTGTRPNVVTSIFYVTYIIFDTPMTILVKQYGPRKILPIYTLLWSLITIFSGFNTSYGSMIACRLLLGVFESGLFPGLNFMMSMFYKRNELSKRVCTIFIALAFSGVIGGLLAYGILKNMNDVHGKHGWQWIFIIEGLMTFGWGIVCFWLIPNSPESAYFLNAEEKEYARQRIQHESSKFQDAGDGFQWSDLWDAIASPNVWLSGVVQLGANTYLFGFSLFLPTILNQLGMGLTTLEVQLMTIPVYFCGAICYGVVSIFADYKQKRFLFMMGGLVFVFIGYSVLLSNVKPGVHFMATFFVAAGGYLVPGLNITWINVNTAGPYKRAAAIGWNQAIGNFGGIIAGQIYRAQDKPRYIIGHGTSIGGAGLAMVSAIALFLLFRHKNAEKLKRLDDPLDKRGDESAHFVYVM